MTWAETSAATAKRQAAKAVMTVPFEPSSMIPKFPVNPKRAAVAAPVESLWKIQNRSINVPVMPLFSICSHAVKLKTFGSRGAIQAFAGTSA
jgi:hypothetical protein